MTPDMRRGVVLGVAGALVGVSVANLRVGYLRWRLAATLRAIEDQVR